MKSLRDAAARTHQWCEFGQRPIAYHLSPIRKALTPASVAMVSAEAWDEAAASGEASL